ncbi:MAG: 4'-phosphopantetheinyl transferase superfamily protein [Phaeodactylibacter sp.]|nr:4'-phosphopantetheinyl transferase superfamily protein [Phaeodactylibacter sp.]
MVIILHTRIEKPLEAARYEALLKPLPTDIRQKARRYRRWQDAHACLFGKLLLAKGLNRLGMDGAAMLHQLQYTEYGRPFLPGPIDFNISHSGEYVACALSNRCRVGIDIEKIKPIHLPDFRRYMTDAEWDSVTSAAEPLRAFYYFWTRKEAAIKAHGSGLSLPLKEVVIGDGKVIMEGKGWPLHEIGLAAGYVCHLVTDEPLKSTVIKGVHF